jgi:transcriptional repressor NrdR
VESLERNFRDANEKENTSKIIGNKIMDHLHRLDDVAYVRFASVYREFKDVDDFIEELKSLIPRKITSDPDAGGCSDNGCSHGG